MTKNTTIVEFTTPMTKKELRVAIGQAVAPVREQSNAIGRRIAEEDAFCWVKHPFTNITYEDKQVDKPMSPSFFTTHDFQFRMVDGKIQQYAVLRETFRVAGQVKGDSMTPNEMPNDLKIEGIKFGKTRSRQGTVWMDFTGEEHTFVFFIALKDGMTFDTPDDLRSAYTTYGRPTDGNDADFCLIDSARGFAHAIKQIKEKHGLTAISDENTIKAITLLYEDRKARAN